MTGPSPSHAVKAICGFMMLGVPYGGSYCTGILLLIFRPLIIVNSLGVRVQYPPDRGGRALAMYSAWARFPEPLNSNKPPLPKREKGRNGALKGLWAV